MRLTDLEKELINSFLNGTEYKEIVEEKYQSFSYPKLIKMMRFITRRYVVARFGHLFSMKTKGPFVMELLTLAFSPGEGKNVPFLLVDMMTVGKKRTVFVEYYDCTANKSEHPALTKIKEQYNHLAEYQEKTHCLACNITKRMNG